MFILDKVKIGSTVQVNLELSKDRLTKEVFETINTSPQATICDFKITDGKGIGVIVKLSNGKEQWFFENEIDILDKNGNIIEKNIENKPKNNLILNSLRNLKYENKNKISDLINPINFMFWLLVSLKDIF